MRLSPLLGRVFGGGQERKRRDKPGGAANGEFVVVFTVGLKGRVSLCYFVSDAFSALTGSFRADV